MQFKLEQLQPILVEKNRMNDILLERLVVSQTEANLKKGICEEDEKLCNIQSLEANELKGQCEMELARVMPLLDEASKALEKIKQEDITLIKSFTSPPRNIYYSIIIIKAELERS